MAKPKSPLLSLGARGTIGDALTYQRRGKEHIVREKPIPRDPYSLNQAYQRWDYRDYAHQWTTLTNSEKQVYRTRASKYHIIGFSQWMRENLKTLPDLAVRLHLDERSGAVAHDSSKNSNDGTIYGALHRPGIINYALRFDGINDYVDCGNDPSLDITDEITIEALIIPENAGTHREIVFKDYSIIRMRVQANNKIRNYATYGGVALEEEADTILVAGQKYHVAMTYDGSFTRIYLNGELDITPVARSGALSITTNHLLVGYYFIVANFSGIEDEFCLYNRALSSATIKRHSDKHHL